MKENQNLISIQDLETSHCLSTDHKLDHHVVDHDLGHQEMDTDQDLQDIEKKSDTVNQDARSALTESNPIEEDSAD